MRISSVLFVVAILVASMAPVGEVQAALVSSSGTVVRIDSYTAYGSGDVVFHLSTNPSVCPGGYWLKATDPGFKTTYALLLTARTLGVAVTGHAYDNDIWSGASEVTCRAYDLFLFS